MKRRRVAANPTALVSAATGAIDCSLARFFTITAPTGVNPTLTVSYLPPGEFCVVKFTQDADGGQTITWSSGGTQTSQTVQGPQASAIAPAAGAGAVTTFLLVGSAENMSTVDAVSKLT